MVYFKTKSNIYSLLFGKNNFKVETMKNKSSQTDPIVISPQNNYESESMNETLWEIFQEALENEEYNSAFNLMEKADDFIRLKVSEDYDSYKDFIQWCKRSGDDEFDLLIEEDSEFNEDDESQSTEDNDDISDNYSEEYDEEELDDQILNQFQEVVRVSEGVVNEDAISVDSGLESLGTMSTRSGRIQKGFVARISYAGGERSPTLELIPSQWRLETGPQGDHVIAYVLLLESLAYCRGVNVKELPEKFCKLACDLLPDESSDFENHRDNILNELYRKREVRKSVTKSIRLDRSLSDNLSEIKNNLKKAETEAVARHIETVSDKLIIRLNSMEEEAFPQDRKNATRQFIIDRMKYLIDTDPRFFSRKDDLKQALDTVSRLERTTLTKKDIENIARNLKSKGHYNTIKDGKEHLGSFRDKNSNIDGMWNLISQDKKLIKLIGSEFKKFKDDLKAELDSLKTAVKGPLAGEELNKIHQITEIPEDIIASIAPLKKYNEGSVVNDIKSSVSNINELTGETKAIRLREIGQNIAKLFDYPKVNKNDIPNNDGTINRIDDEYVLYQAIPRLFIVTFSAFNELQKLSIDEKNDMMIACCEQILKLQLWEGHIVKNESSDLDVPLNINLLTEKINQFAQYNIDTGEFMMKAEVDHPPKNYSSNRIPNRTNINPTSADAMHLSGHAPIMRNW